MGISLTATHNDKIIYQNEGEQLTWYDKVSTAEPLPQRVKDNSIADGYQYQALKYVYADHQTTPFAYRGALEQR